MELLAAEVESFVDWKLRLWVDLTRRKGKRSSLL